MKKNLFGRSKNDEGDSSFLRRHKKGIATFIAKKAVSIAVEAMALQSVLWAIGTGNPILSIAIYAIALAATIIAAKFCGDKGVDIAINTVAAAAVMVVSAMLNFVALPVVIVALANGALKLWDLKEKYDDLKELAEEPWAKEAAAIGTIAAGVALADTSEYAYNKYVAEELHKQVQVREIDPELVEEIKKNEEELRKMLPKEIEIEFRTRK